MEHLYELLDLEVAEALPSDQLLHALTCHECREWLVGHLLDQEAEEEGGEGADLYSAAFERLERGTTDAAESASRRRKEAEELAGELLSLPPDMRETLVTKERFQSLDLLGLLLELSHASQPANPARARALAETAVTLAVTLGDRTLDAAGFLPRAFCLGANACRLQHDLPGAEARLAKAAPFLEKAEERAFYCRTAGLVRWEEGRSVEAEALLERAARTFQAEGAPEEADVCLALLGLLAFEENQVAQALPRLHKAWRGLDRESRPQLALTTGMSFAAALALAQQPGKARQVRDEAWSLYSAITNPRDMVRIYGLEGRLLGYLGDSAEAEELLDSVRRKLLAEPSVAEAVLVSLDLGMVLATQGKAREIAELAEELKQSLEGDAPVHIARVALMSLEEEVLDGDLMPWEWQLASRVALLRSIRAVGLRLRPLPFV
ncbi:MAG TPA: hypothetical protein VF789_16915 [Thermoanaerobaculia bacterium]